VTGRSFVGGRRGRTRQRERKERERSEISAWLGLVWLSGSSRAITKAAVDPPYCNATPLL
jgi:hypothetical protein